MGKIIGNTTATPNPRPDWNQTDEAKADYIRNKPAFPIVDQNYSATSVNAQSGVAVAEAVASLVDSAPETLNTLKELATALGNDENFATTIATSIGELEMQIDELEKQIADILYKAIDITSFTHNKGLVERGTIITDITLSWATNKTPTTLTLDGEAIDVTTTNKTINGLSITWDKNKTWMLKVTDDREATDTMTTSITFCNGVYYGVGNTENGFDSTLVTGLTKKLQTSKAYDFTVNPSNQYVYYAIPTRLGTVSFKVSGFEGGFEAPEMVSVTNSSNYTESYYVYRSTNKITGSTTVDVT